MLDASPQLYLCGTGGRGEFICTADNDDHHNYDNHDHHTDKDDDNNFHIYQVISSAAWGARGSLYILLPS